MEPWFDSESRADWPKFDGPSNGDQQGCATSSYGRTRLRAMPLTMMTMTKWMHGICKYGATPGSLRPSELHYKDDSNEMENMTSLNVYQYLQEIIWTKENGQHKDLRVLFDIQAPVSRPYIGIVKTGLLRRWSWNTKTHTDNLLIKKCISGQACWKLDTGSFLQEPQQAWKCDKGFKQSV